MTERKTMEEWRAEFRRRGYKDGEQAVRDRVFAILDHPAAQADYDEAKRLALETDLSANDAIAELQRIETEATIKRAGEILGAGGES